MRKTACANFKRSVVVFRSDGLTRPDYVLNERERKDFSEIRILRRSDIFPDQTYNSAHDLSTTTIHDGSIMRTRLNSVFTQF